MGAWIETRGVALDNRLKTVAPYMGAWIETPPLGCLPCIMLSHPIWVRRLKPGHQNYKAISSTIIPLVPSTFALRYISIMLSLYLRYASAIPPLCLRFVNGGRSSSQRRMIEFTTKDERRTNEGTTEKELLYQQ